MAVGALAFIVIILFILVSNIRVVPQAEEYILERLGGDLECGTTLQDSLY